MSVTIVTPPTETPVTLADIKAHLRIDFDDEDALLVSLIEAATGQIEARLGRALVMRTVRQTFKRFSPVLRLSASPVQSVASVAYLDAANVDRTLSASAYRVEGVGDVATIAPVTPWPATGSEPDAVAVTYVAGYGDAEEVPGAIRNAVKMLAGGLYNHRESTTAADLMPAIEGVEDVITANREWAF
ncbi:head-tail connector protein [Oharaeibacter diazotrophicus]|uniref:Putative phiE125 gp8 family phage protein n=1 Tax=Oharaeibacter diazotrophicus TaxID=1920512 RepID=A0A4R6RIA7_9HYPH|nr:head-tail connector protein [Oharaeibacter diazotrophicus]TDP85597.1 putative phiE125 gp8 family phage protein [Oharaeibacter diazotrophicus]BBE74566.1 phage gp6-like head-tail connector protein [Pleomorphomonas sp. SM30]GLS75732.1 hypothetical protein GCM10007904_10670 [Oharaeibacter diazotrophicus]